MSKIAFQHNGFFFLCRMREGQKQQLDSIAEKSREGQEGPGTPGTPGQGQPPRTGLEPITSVAPLNAHGPLGQQPLALHADLNKRSSSSDSFCKDDRSDSPILNLSSKSAQDNQSELR